jgi:hypothetical protein
MSRANTQIYIDSEAKIARGVTAIVYGLVLSRIQSDQVKATTWSAT